MVLVHQETIGLIGYSYRQAAKHIDGGEVFFLNIERYGTTAFIQTSIAIQGNIGLQSAGYDNTAVRTR